MATAAELTRGSTFVALDDAPEVQAAAAKVEEIAGRQAVVAARLSRYESLLNPHYRQHLGAVSEDEGLEAYEHVAATRVEHARTTRELRAAEAAATRAREAERGRRRAAFTTQQRDLVRKLDALFAAAAAVNATLAALEQRARELVGEPGVGGFAWEELLPETPSRASRLTDWRRAATRAGLLEE